MKCDYEGLDGSQCQIQEEISTSEDGSFCQYHLPFNEKLMWDQAQLHHFKSAFEHIKTRTPEGTIMPPGEYILGAIGGGPRVLFKQCEFNSHTTLTFHCSDSHFIFMQCTFIGVNFLFKDRPPIVNFKQCTFNNGVQFLEGLEPFPRINIFKCTFEELYFRNVTFGNGIRFHSTSFTIAPDFHGASFHQLTDFINTTFSDTRSLNAESAYRTLRLAMEANKNRNDEGLFFSLEQQSRRHQLPFWSFSRFSSWIYHITSDYGRSFERIAAVFLGTQMFFYLIYHGIFSANRTSVHNDLTPFLFTTTQIFKPFELVSVKHLTADNFGVYEGILTEETVKYLPYITSLHSTFSLGLFGLFLLALRWRFKRG